MGERRSQDTHDDGSRRKANVPHPSASGGGERRQGAARGGCEFGRALHSHDRLPVQKASRNARVRLPLVAGLAVMLAAVTRSSGGLLAIPVLAELLKGPDGKWRFTPSVFVLLLVPLSVGPYLLLQQQIFNAPLYFAHVQAGWGRHPSFPLEPLFRFDLSPDYHVFALVAVALAVYGFRRKERLSYRVSSAVALLLPLSTGILRGIHRYLASNFPLYIFGARWLEQRPRARLAYRVIGIAVMALFAFQWGKNRHPN